MSKSDTASQSAARQGDATAAPTAVGTRGLLLVADSNPNAAQALGGLLRLSGYAVVVAHDGQAVTRLMEQQQLDLVILDAHLPGPDPYALCVRLKGNERTGHTPLLVVTDRYDRREHVLYIEAGADEYCCVVHDGSALAARVDALLQARASTGATEQAEQVVQALVRAVEAKDADTAGHLRRLGSYAVLLGRHLGVQGVDLLALRHGAMLHDVGKIGVDEALVRRRGALKPAEQALVRQHTLIGERIVQPLRLSTQVAPMVRGHHERWDGQGYPNGLAGEAIAFGARIVAVLDAFDALTAPRPAMRVLSVAAALAHLHAGAGSRWDARVVAALTDCMARPQSFPAHA